MKHIHSLSKIKDKLLWVTAYLFWSFAIFSLHAFLNVDFIFIFIGQSLHSLVFVRFYRVASTQEKKFKHSSEDAKIDALRSWAEKNY